MVATKPEWTRLKCHEMGGAWQRVTATRKRKKKCRRHRLLPLIRVEGGHYKLKCCRMLFIRRPLRVASVADSEPTAGSRYPSLHLQTLPSCVSCPRCMEAVIHSNATRNKLKSGQSVCAPPSSPFLPGWEDTGDGGQTACLAEFGWQWWWLGAQAGQFAMLDWQEAHFNVADGRSLFKGPFP